MERQSVAGCCSRVQVASPRLQTPKCRLCPLAPYGIDDEVHGTSERLELFEKGLVAEDGYGVGGREFFETVDLSCGCDDPLRAGLLGQLDEGVAEGAGRSKHQNALARFQLGFGEGQFGPGADRADGRGYLTGQPVGYRNTATRSTS